MASEKFINLSKDSLMTGYRHANTARSYITEASSMFINLYSRIEESKLWAYFTSHPNVSIPSYESFRDIMQKSYDPVDGMIETCDSLFANYSEYFEDKEFDSLLAGGSVYSSSRGQSSSFSEISYEGDLNSDGTEAGEEAALLDTDEEIKKPVSDIELPNLDDITLSSTTSANSNNDEFDSSSHGAYGDGLDLDNYLGTDSYGNSFGNNADGLDLGSSDYLDNLYTGAGFVNGTGIGNGGIGISANGSGLSGNNDIDASANKVGNTMFNNKSTAGTVLGAAGGLGAAAMGAVGASSIGGGSSSYSSPVGGYAKNDDDDDDDKYKFESVEPKILNPALDAGLLKDKDKEEQVEVYYDETTIGNDDVEIVENISVDDANKQAKSSGIGGASTAILSGVAAAGIVGGGAYAITKEKEKEKKEEEESKKENTVDELMKSIDKYRNI